MAVTRFSIALVAALGFSLPAVAQDLGGAGAGGGSTPSLGGAGVSVGGTASGVGAGPSPAASAGSSSINSLNVDDAARTGDFGAATTIGGTYGGTDDFQSLARTGPSRLYDIPRPHVGVQLEQIRSALRMWPSATPKPDGS